MLRLRIFFLLVVVSTLILSSTVSDSFTYPTQLYASDSICGQWVVRYLESVNDYSPLFIVCGSNKMYVVGTIPYTAWQNFIGQYMIIHNPSVASSRELGDLLLLNASTSFQIVSSCPSSCSFSTDLPVPTTTRRCPRGVGPNGIAARDHNPNDLTQQQKQWLWGMFGHTGIVPSGYGGESCAGINNLSLTRTPTFVSVATPTPRPCPIGVGPNGIIAGDYRPATLTQEQRQWLWEKFGHTGMASEGYGGERCAPSFTSRATATITSRLCPSGIGPGGIISGDYDPNKLTQMQKQWLWEIFGHLGIAPVGYGGESCRKSEIFNSTATPSVSLSRIPPATSVLTLTPTRTPISQSLLDMFWRQLTTPVDSGQNDPKKNLVKYFGIKWPRSELPIPVYLDDSVPVAWEQSIVEAVNAWNIKFPAPLFNFVVGGRKLGTEGGIYIVYSQPNFWIAESDSPGETNYWDPIDRRWSKDEIGAKHLGHPDGKIVGVRIEIRDTKLAKVSSRGELSCRHLGFLFCNAYSANKVVMHELGHALGFDHSLDSDDLMYWNPTKTEISDPYIRKISEWYFSP